MSLILLTKIIRLAESPGKIEIRKIITEGLISNKYKLPKTVNGPKTINTANSPNPK